MENESGSLALSLGILESSWCQRTINITVVYTRSLKLVMDAHARWFNYYGRGGWFVPWSAVGCYGAMARGVNANKSDSPGKNTQHAA